MPVTDPRTPSTPPATLRNLGPKSTALLAQLGITTLAQLRERGALATYLAAKQLEPTASLNLLYALVGAVDDIDWRIVQRERKLELLMALEALPATTTYETTHHG